MSLNIRRVVTGHDDQGRAKVIDRRDGEERHFAAPRRAI